MEKFIDRLKKYIDYKGLSYNKVTVDADLSIGLLGKAIKENRGISTDTLEKLLHCYKDLNPTWLLTGIGEMIVKNGYNKKEPALQVNESDDQYKKAIDDKDKQIDTLNKLVTTLETQINEANKNTETYRNLLNASVKGK